MDRDETFPRPLGTWGVEWERGAHQGPAGLMWRYESLKCGSRSRVRVRLAAPVLPHTSGSGVSNTSEVTGQGMPPDLFWPLALLHEKTTWPHESSEMGVQELAVLRAQISSSSVNVEVDAAPHQDLARILEEIRHQYEGAIDKNRREMESWYKGKFDELNKTVTTRQEDITLSRSEISELRRTLQSLEIELQSQLSLKAALEGTLGETESRYSLQLSQLQAVINRLEAELSQVRMDIERQGNEYKLLLDIKTRLELEIAEYRRLLDGEIMQRQTVKVVEIVTPPPKPEPVVTKRVRTVIEEMVDGKVVSRTEDVDIEVMTK
ncbi:keratin, type I cytoskeletal 17-like [Sinocyclocheilus grahami]|uniref:keratin, type I cytoskeletal 17-like n=1 Tax=Sinocyclocheilus grahami TaxID=75366 RepID=UPI0007ACBD67|nr:PREDICTED: keratin, type I cytoskeletal 17-like [Sinocyclocheilus grahami]